MKPIKLSEIVSAVDGTLIGEAKEYLITEISTDSRNIKQNCLFVPLVGERFDGHDYIEKAFSEGALAALTAKETAAKGTLILVKDTLRALQALAAYYRSLFSVPVIGLTGSVGKTTTKEMTAAVLSQKYHTLKTEGNFNNEIGVPLTVFRMEEAHEAAVIEMGMSGFGEIDRLAAIAKPELAMLTNIGMSHIELLGSQENIYRAKSEILSHIQPNGTVLLNGDDPILRKHKEEIAQKAYTVGTDADCDATASNIVSDVSGVRFDFSGLGHEFSVRLTIPGEHNVWNALFACVVGILYGVKDENIVRALEDFRPTNMRMDVIECGGFTIINDCYNAAPDSMRAALKVLGAYPKKRIAVLGDMACMGNFSKEEHLRVGKIAAEEKLEELFTVGEQARYIAQGAQEHGMSAEKIHSFQTVEQACEVLAQTMEQNCCILVKASRVMELERVTRFLQENCQKNSGDKELN